MDGTLLKLLQVFPGEYKIVIGYKKDSFTLEIIRRIATVEDLVEDRTIYYATNSNYERLVKETIELLVCDAIKDSKSFDKINM